MSSPSTSPSTGTARRGRGRGSSSGHGSNEGTLTPARDPSATVQPELSASNAPSKRLFVPTRSTSA
ncbi:hypothetical protein BT63DRAFT_454972 [Microthyrium microscopicum]|uniref:Uncharacterized protein n=1 Tax=Microthyrium microscopicum TaxID=703497 RepID=A0A6A6U9P6_9PEZI|nr:hypothetical protein BT63DRAFT_454972 [Microthyrium microscopicum]